MTDINVRRVAYELLKTIERSGQYSNIALDSAIKKNGIEGKDRGLFTALVYGVIEKKLTLDYTIDSLAEKPEKIEPEVRILLRLGLYQIMFLDKIPAHAAVNESVSLARSSGRAFVNAILRSYMRKKNELCLPDKDTEPYKYLSIKYSFAEWICERLCAEYGFDGAEAYLVALSSPPSLTLRVNTEKISREELLHKINASGTEASPCRHSPFGISLSGSVPVSAIPGFTEGEFFVQDEASHICVAALSPKENTKLLDACSCPGGKSFSSAIEMKNRGEIFSFDLHKNKLSLIESGAKRLGIDIIKTREQDGRVFVPELAGYFDSILCDVPCSGLGVMAKKPEIRYKDKGAVDALPEIQYNILDNTSRYIKAGGTLVYSTCTTLRAENEDNVNKFLESHPDFEAVDFTVGEISSVNGMLTLLPHIHGTDGFFIAKLQKKDSKI